MSSPPSQRLAELSLSQQSRESKANGTNGIHTPQTRDIRAGAAAVPDDELERFRREWKQEVAAKRPGVDVAGIRWKEKREEPVLAQLVDEQSHEPAPPIDMSDESWPTLGTSAPKSPNKATRPAASTAGKQQKSPTKATTKLPQKPAQKAPKSPTKPTTSAARAPRPSPGPSSSDDETLPFPQRKRDAPSAVLLYTRAVEAEQSGRLNDAVHLYRKAFRADDDADRLYSLTIRKAEAERVQQETVRQERKERPPSPSPADIVDPSEPKEEAYEFTRHVQVHPDYERAGRGRVSRLTALIEARKGVPLSELPGYDETSPAPERYDPAEAFKPLDPQQSVPLACLPTELVDRVLRYLDVGSLERLGMTCWRARLLTASSGTWRRLAERIYRPPMVPDDLVPRDLARRHRDEWRTTLLEEERVRMDGCYISVCHYIRPGAGEQWVTITHIKPFQLKLTTVTYHRFLRFYPDGHVISFQTTDHPSDVVPVLRPTLRAKGLHFGRWALERGEGEEKGRARIVITELLEPGQASPKYEFEMSLALRETGRGRWNKLDLLDYSSINLATGETLGLSLKHQKPFYFSKVRSYNPPF